jgi:hypothetical protein
MDNDEDIDDMDDKDDDDDDDAIASMAQVVVGTFVVAVVVEGGKELVTLEFVEDKFVEDKEFEILEPHELLDKLHIDEFCDFCMFFNDSK